MSSASGKVTLWRSELRTLSVLNEREARSRLDIYIAMGAKGWALPGLLGIYVALKRLEQQGFVIATWKAATCCNGWRPKRGYLRTDKSKDIEPAAAGPTKFEHIFLSHHISLMYKQEV